MRTDVKITYEAYRALPEAGPRYQLLEGELRLSPAPNTPHQRILVRLLQSLAPYVEEQGLGEIFVSPIDVILSDENVVQPDLLFVSRGRKNQVALEGIRGAPDLCVEILSPSSRELDLGLKRMLYARYGAAEYWIVEPDKAKVRKYVFRTSAEVPEREFLTPDDLVSDLFPGWSLPVARLFRGN